MKNKRTHQKAISLVGFALIITTPLSGHATESKEVDPYEGFNRVIWQANSFVDRWVMKPTAKAYKAVTPDILERGFGNFFNNISNIPTAVNNLLQGKPGQAGQDLTRFIFNTTFGGLGFYDFASDVGLPIHEEDFGQTLGAWGVPQGPYMVLPFLGPSTVRDTVGFGVDLTYDPYDQLNPVSDKNSVTALRLVDLRAQLLRFDNLAPGDEYLFFRDAYLQRRAGQVRDGKTDPAVEDDFLDDDF